MLDDQRFSIGTQRDLFEQGQEINRLQFDRSALTLDGDAHVARKIDLTHIVGTGGDTACW